MMTKIKKLQINKKLAFTLIELFTMRKRKGFTLIELLVVVAIIGILSTVVVVSVNGAQARAKDAKIKTYLASVQKQASIYFINQGNYSGLNCTSSGTATSNPPSCESLSGNNELSQIALIASDIKAVSGNTDGLGISAVSTEYNAFAKLPSTVGSDAPQSVVVSNAGASQTTDSSTTGLVGWWKLNEGTGSSTADSSIYKRSSVPIGSASWTTISPSGSGKALSFNGTSYLEVGNSNDNYLPFTTFSICVREKTSWTLPNPPNNFAKGMISFGYGLTFSIKPSNGNFESLFTSDGTMSNLKYPLANGNYADGNLHNLCLTYDGTNIRMYADGVLKSTVASTWSSTWAPPTPKVRIGLESNNDANKFYGILNDVRFYNRAISLDEVKDIYNNPI